MNVPPVGKLPTVKSKLTELLHTSASGPALINGSGTIVIFLVPLLEHPPLFTE